MSDFTADKKSVFIFGLGFISGLLVFAVGIFVQNRLQRVDNDSSESERTSYSLGYNQGRELLNQKIWISDEAFRQGLAQGFRDLSPAVALTQNSLNPMNRGGGGGPQSQQENPENQKRFEELEKQWVVDFFDKTSDEKKFISVGPYVVYEVIVEAPDSAVQIKPESTFQLEISQTSFTGKSSDVSNLRKKDLKLSQIDERYRPAVEDMRLGDRRKIFFSYPGAVGKKDTFVVDLEVLKVTTP